MGLIRVTNYLILKCVISLESSAQALLKEKKQKTKKNERKEEKYGKKTKKKENMEKKKREATKKKGKHFHNSCELQPWPQKFAHTFIGLITKRLST